MSGITLVSTAAERVRTAAKTSWLRDALNVARHRGLRHDDVFIASYPRSGNTLLRFLLADVATGSQADFESIDRLIPAVGHHGNAPALASGHRLIKTHEPHRRDYKKAVYLVRDVRGVLNSWWATIGPEPGDDLDTFVSKFASGRGFSIGSWEDHVRSWQRAHQQSPSSVRIYRFEDLRSQPATLLGEIAEFVGIPASQEQIEAAVARNDLEAMKRLEEASTDYLRRVGYRTQGVRSGHAQGWRELLSGEHMATLAPTLDVNRELGYADGIAQSPTPGEAAAAS
jgi:hypothetical protein